MEDQEKAPKADPKVALVRNFFSERFGATLSSYDKYLAQTDRFFTADGQLSATDLVDFVYRTPIEEVSTNRFVFNPEISITAWALYISLR